MEDKAPDISVVSAETPPEPPQPPVTVIPRKNLREAVEDVFWDMGGPEGMMTWARESTANKRIFYKDILPKLIPKQLTGELSGPGGGPMKLVVEWAGELPASAPAGTALQAIADVVTQVVADEEF